MLYVSFSVKYLRFVPKKVTFLFSACFGGHICNHSNGNSHINSRLLHLDYCSNKLIRRVGGYMRRDIRFPTMWYKQPAKPQISLRIRAVWSEPMLVAWIFWYSRSVKLLTEHHLEFLSLKKAAQARLSLHLSKCHIVGNHVMAQLWFFMRIRLATALLWRFLDFHEKKWENWI